MNRVVIRIAAASAVALAVAAPPSSALAQEAPLPPPPAPPPPPPPSARIRAPTTVIVAPAPPRDVVVVEERTPNVGLIGGGLVMFGLSYGTSVIIGAASDREGDQRLYVPIAGPWMDLAMRAPCPTAGPCGNDVGNKALLVTDGILQAAGVLQIVGGFLFPQTVTVTRTKAGVDFTPTAGLHSIGIAAHGAF